MNNSIIMLDTEYTVWEGAKESGWALPNQHREIVQIAAIKFDPTTGSEISAFDVIVKPKYNGNLSKLFIDLTTITQETVDQKGIPFQFALKRFYEFSNSGETPVVCYNADEDVFRENCELHGIQFPFLKKWKKIRPILHDLGINTNINSSGTLHTLTDHPLDGGHVHYALHDVRSMGRFIEYKIRHGDRDFIQTLPVAPDVLVPLDLQKARNTRERSVRYE